MRVLAIDHGAARCGCALSDPSGTIVRPIGPIEPCAASAVPAIVAEHRVEMVVVGLPVSLDGREGAQAAAARGFAADLATRVDVPVRTYDERLTTKLAAASRRGGSRAAEDSLAAAHLLESFLRASEREGRR
ncbi:MAG: Holliday junction resolvase RuvX [Thermoleophilia bacterium]|nr:Holliday junction resolvase RuvX [Thermoleophilia bacterium]GIK77357.1 MAG: putative pre-16S rRNA nuclease [Actinomycetes bacterium]